MSVYNNVTLLQFDLMHTAFSVLYYGMLLEFVDFDLSHFLQFGQSLLTAFDSLQMEIIIEIYTSIT